MPKWALPTLAYHAHDGPNQTLVRCAGRRAMDEDDDGTGTSVTMEVGQVSVTIATSAGWTPEMIEHTLTRMRRQIVATVRQLGLIDIPEDAPKDAPA